MTERRPAWVLLAACTLISTACVTWSRKDVKTMTTPLPEGTAVLSVVRNDGGVIEFTKTNPGRVRGYAVVGTGKDAAPREVEIVAPFSGIRQDDNGHIAEIVDGKGQGWIVRAVIKSGEGRMTILGAESNQYSIPLSEVRTVQVRRDNVLPITAIVLGGLVVLPVIILLIAAI